jgi:hypothetical protein
MRRALWSLGLAAAVLLSVVVPVVFGQDAGEPLFLNGYHVVVPLRGTSGARVRRAISAATVASSSIAMWNYTVTSPIDGKTYSGTMVGSSPYMNGARTTNIPTIVIPLKVVFPDGSVFDPSVIDSCSPAATPIAQVLGSPIFQPAAWTMNGINIGSGQYVDEFQRANFYDANVSVTGDSYHTVLGPVTTLATQTISIPASHGQVWSGIGGCKPLGVMDLSTFDSIVKGTLLPSLAAQGVNPGNFPLFVLHDVVMGNPGTSPYQSCCVIGYHGAFGFPVQTYAVADYDSTFLFRTSPDIAPTSHEIGEWMDDPLGTNPTPSWGRIGQVAGCQTNLEVGDPLSGSLYSQSGRFGVTMPNGLTYYPQQLAFFSWFYRQNPSIGVGGLYSNSGTFTSGAGGLCQ